MGFIWGNGCDWLGVFRAWTTTYKWWDRFDRVLGFSRQELVPTIVTMNASICSTLLNCWTCLESSCVWCMTTNACTALADCGFAPIKQDCCLTYEKKCDTCLKDSHCGFCHDTTGIQCQSGSLAGPRNGTCTNWFKSDCQGALYYYFHNNIWLFGIWKKEIKILIIFFSYFHYRDRQPRELSNLIPNRASCSNRLLLRYIGDYTTFNIHQTSFWAR